MGILPSIAARELRVSPSTLRLWEAQGKIRAERSGGNWRLYKESDILRLKRKMDKRRA
ncbi:MAG: MerR family transcriptional regulator [Elusimicrobia bacterium]|nr:MerR family transcriptional regulator [Elusimicrobiota bacterium]